MQTFELNLTSWYSKGRNVQAKINMNDDKKAGMPKILINRINLPTKRPYSDFSTMIVLFI